MTRTPLLALGAAALILGACAKVGTLEQPAPLYGAKAKARYQAQKDAAAKAAKPAASEPEALPPETTLPQQEPPRTAPVTGEAPSPFGAPPPSALPNPFAEPQPPQ